MIGSRASRVVRGRGRRRGLRRRGLCIRIADRIRERMGLKRSEENGSGRGRVRLR